MVAITVTPLIVRVVFLFRRGRSNLFSSGVSWLIMSALDGTFSRWYLPAVLIFSRFTSSRVGEGIESRVLMISRRATSCDKIKVPEEEFTSPINKLH